MVSQAMLNEIRRRLVERFSPQRIILFGSQARGTADDDLRVAAHTMQMSQPVPYRLARIPIPQANVRAAHGQFEPLLGFVVALLVV